MMLTGMLANGYFPKELPPTFRTDAFASFASSSGPLELAASPDRNGLVSRPGVHNLGRPGQVRRKLQLWNPFNFYELARTLDDGWTEVEAHLAGSEMSLSKPVRDPLDHRAAITAHSGNDLSHERARVRAVARFVLQTDVARFYHSIYTHSIPWALHGKDWAKSNRSGGLGNDLDRALRNGQEGQTLGIPIGPDTSLIIAEIIGCAVDKQLSGIGTDRLRFIDDFEFGFATRSAAERGLAKVEELLSEYELALNPLKTRISPLPIELDRPWRRELRDYSFDDYDLLTGDELLAYFNLVFSLHRTFPTDAVIAYSVGRLRAISVSEGDWPLYQNLLMQCAVAEPASLPTVIGQLSRHRQYGISENLRRVIQEVVGTHAPLGHGSEVAWALWAAIWFDMDLPPELDERLVGMEDPAVALVALHARECGLLALPTAAKAWSERVTQAELYDRGWPLAYESVRQGWLTSSEEEALRGDANFGRLFEADVSFYDRSPGQPVAYLWDATGYGDFILDPDDTAPVVADF